MFFVGDGLFRNVVEVVVNRLFHFITVRNNCLEEALFNRNKNSSIR